ncbi:MAG TPA: hypothetical protein VM553_11275 [Dongiaceae bacterium]|nr:hypothetical protein [Dongiaceae bacterium]
MTSSLQMDVATFFDDFVDVFASFNGGRIAQRYAVPYLAIRADSTSELFSSAAAIGAYFQGIVDDYYRQGCRSCRYRDLQVVPMGSMSALGTVTWELLRADSSVLIAWRESYHLAYVDGRLLAFVSVDHAEKGQAEKGQAE